MQFQSSMNYECGTEFETHSIKYKENLFSGKTKYQEINIFDTHHYGKLLVLDGLIQSSQSDEYRYHEALVHPAMLSHPEPKSVLIIGGGEGATAREVLKHPSVESCLMVDIDSQLIEQCEKHLPEWHQGAFANPKLELVICDGLKFVEECDDIFDVIIVDVCDSFDGESPTEGFFCQKFFRDLKRRLELRGTIAYQAMSASNNENEDFIEAFNGLKRVFTFANPYATYIPSFSSEWGFVTVSDVHNASTFSLEKIAQILDTRGLSDQLKFFDAVTMQNMFSLPKDIRKMLDTAHTSVASKRSKPIILEHEDILTACI